MDNFFIVSYEMMGVMFIVVLIFTLLCSMVPIKKVKEIKKTPEEIAEEKRLERNRKAREYYRKRKIERILRRELP